MSTLFSKDSIEFLVNKKYPLGYLLPSNSKGGIDQEEYKKRQEQATAYREELRCKSEKQIKKLYDAENKKHQKEIQLKLEKEEQFHFFNLPSANADFKLWGKAACWTLEEAIALCFGKNPALVSWEKIKSFTGSSFVKKYSELRFLALRAKAANLLYDSLIPGFFITWAKLNKIDYPQELEEEVIANGDKTTDWKSKHDEQLKNYNELYQILADYKNFHNRSKVEREQLYEKMKAKYEEHISFLLEHISAQGQTLDEINKERQIISNQLKGYEQQINNLEFKEKPPHTKERESMLKLIAGMAAAYHGYDPAEKRSEVINAIVSDLDLKGISINRDTVKKFLREGAMFLPSISEED